MGSFLSKNRVNYSFQSLFPKKEVWDRSACPIPQNSVLFHDVLDLTILLEKQDEIDRAMIHKIKKHENTFVHVSEASRGEYYLRYKDSWPLFKQRMTIWGTYL
jgi:hypothetical protein